MKLPYAKGYFNNQNQLGRALETRALAYLVIEKGYSPTELSEIG
ncbi:MAG: hypothetical protein QGD96_10455 [Anaerolineae bacterium]|nr:hypothetical protein [Anaerolineae bacterium]